VSWQKGIAREWLEFLGLIVACLLACHIIFVMYWIAENTDDTYADFVKAVFTNPGLVIVILLIFYLILFIAWFIRLSISTIKQLRKKQT
jgi:succinate dehydrogenase hydrophobic anchor subunit